MIVIIDYGMGNLGSHVNMLKKVGFRNAIITSDLKNIAAAEKLVLPGVGSFDNGMTNLNNLGISEIIREKVLVQKTPILGICLGMQLLAQKSEEGVLPGLGLLEAEVKKFHFGKNSENLKIPHMGWNTVKIAKKSKLFKNMTEQENRFYFVHSFHWVSDCEKDILTTTNYGYDFTSAVENNNIVGSQFHPEKSHKFGMKFYANFMEL